MLARVVKLGDSKELITTDDLPFIIAEVLESKNYHHIKLLNCSVTSGLDLKSTVSIRVDVDGDIQHAVGYGNGGFDAFIHAMNEVMAPKNYVLPDLVDYEVRIPGRSHQRAYRVRDYLGLQRTGNQDPRRAFQPGVCRHTGDSAHR
ncbi:MAG: alpha-isopropylmalate synthase regulatory domain-containing protein [Halioglobus sp.]